MISSKIKHAPNVFAFTEQGVAMLSGILNSDRAVEVNIAIRRAFVKLRELIATKNDLSRRLDELENMRQGLESRFSFSPCNGQEPSVYWSAFTSALT